ncbi:complement C1s-1 subcomponent-like [Mustelus asterias]
MTVPSDYGVIISFTNIDIKPSTDCVIDNIQIDSEEATYPPICGTSRHYEKSFQFPQEYYTAGNWMTVILNSDCSKKQFYTGFSANYSAFVKHCSDDILEHGIIEPQKSEFDFKDWVQASCELGYQLYVWIVGNLPP